MRYLGLGHNHLSSVPDFLGDDFVDCYFIDYAINSLNRFPRPPDHLYQLYVTGNPLRHIPQDTFSRASHLQTLFASDCDVTQIDEGAWRGATKLAWILLEVINCWVASYSWWLHKQNNKMTSLNSTTFADLPSLTAVFLTGNLQLNQIACDTFTRSRDSLERLLMDSCGLYWLDWQLLDELSAPDFYVWLGRNPWNCDCDLEVSFSVYGIFLILKFYF